MNRKRKLVLRRSRMGALTVEMAVCLPILFLVLFTSYEFARANMLKHASESAAYEGARVGIVPGATVQQIEGAVQFVLGTVGVRDFNVIVDPPVIEQDTETVQVTVEVPYEANTTFSGFFLEDPTFRGTTLLTREIPR